MDFYSPRLGYWTIETDFLLFHYIVLISFRSWFLFPILGLPRLSRDLSRRDWQSAVQAQVREAAVAVLRAAGLAEVVKVLLVWNNTNRRVPTAPTRYFAQMSSVGLSRKVRDAFAGFFRQSNPLVRPNSLSQVSIRNKVTLATRVRLAIMKVLGSNYKDKNVGASFNVKGFESRPVLTIFPPPTAKDARQRTFTFIEAVSSLPTQFSEGQLKSIFRVIGSNFRGQIQATFVVVRDDDHDRMLGLIRADQQGRRTVASGSGVGAAMTYSGVVRQEGSGMEVESAPSLVASLLNPPPPPPLPASRPPVESPSVQGSPRRHPRGTGSQARRTTGSKKSRKRRRSATPTDRDRSRRRRNRSQTTTSSSSSSSTSSSSNES